MKKAIEFIEKTPVTKIVSSILIMAMAVIMTMNVVTRYVFNFSFKWGDEILRYMAVYLAFIGTAAAWEYAGTHVAVTLFVEKVLPEKVRPAIRLLSDIITLVFLGFVTRYGFVLVKKIQASHQASPALRVPMYLVYMIVPICMIISILHVILQIVHRKTFLYPRE